MRTLAAAAALALLAGGLGALLGPPPRASARPDVLLVTVDTVRADHCSAYGYARPTTPVLAGVARAGVLFEHAYAPTATTSPSLASLFTALPPAAHGVLKNGHVLAEDLDTLAERLARAGYDTAAVVSSYVLDRRFGLAQGFAAYDDRLVDRRGTRGAWIWEGHVGHGAFDQDARVTTDEAAAWLRARRRQPRPFFLWVHYFDPHFPYQPARPYRALFGAPPGPRFELDRDVGRYDAEIRETDGAIGRLLAVLRSEGREASTLLVVAGDHGEGLMQHGWMHHGLHLYEEAVRVPVLFRWPAGLPAGRRLAGPAQLADVAPTILELAALPAGDGRASADRGAGMSLARALRGGAAIDPARPIFFQRRAYDAASVPSGRPVAGVKRAVRRGRWKYIEARDEGTRELYDLARDPRERRNRAGDAPAEAADLAALLALWERTGEAREPAGPVAPADAARLRALGYTQ